MVVGEYVNEVTVRLLFLFLFLHRRVQATIRLAPRTSSLTFCISDHPSPVNLCPFPHVGSGASSHEVAACG
jgi:hypothetical protein